MPWRSGTSPKKGFTRINAILDTVAANRIHTLNTGMGEVVSVLVRKRNAGILSTGDFAQALASFDEEIVRGANVTKASVTGRLVTASFAHIVAHSINSTDA
ncbi:MAG: hypothetical protein L0Y71_19480 [Gemmataceae bacterium]|nr:hypothetical protein [Gemmataceae bacterium]